MKTTLVTRDYLSRASFWMMVTTLIYFLMNGAQLFETALIVPSFTQNPPDSFHVFRGPYALDFKAFWILFHSVHEITFILAIVFCWKLLTVRRWLLVLFVIHVAVRVWTLLYFAPNMIEFQQIARSGGERTDLLQRAIDWKNYNYLRVAIFIAVSLGLVPLLNNVLRLKHRGGETNELKSENARKI